MTLKVYLLTLFVAGFFVHHTTAINLVIRPNVVVALDGSGQFTSLTTALQHIPTNHDYHTTIYVIHVKAGTYHEHVIITSKQTNITMLGDGATKTIFTGHLNKFFDDIKTMDTATFTVLGSGFICKNVGFRNTAGPNAHQAVALRVNADMAVFYLCRMDGYQDTLYAHGHRQFYRQCIITGTVDFIFGDASAIFQNCVMKIRRPNIGQQCAVTAHERHEINSPSGFVLQNCTITGDRDFMPVKHNFEAYLGRPWKNFSRTIIMESYIDSVISPRGWLEWSTSPSNSNTCWYSEYKNRGPGANMTGRVKWPGIKKIHSRKQAKHFTVRKFIHGESWIRKAKVPFTRGL